MKPSNQCTLARGLDSFVTLTLVSIAHLEVIVMQNNSLTHASTASYFPHQLQTIVCFSVGETLVRESLGTTFDGGCLMGRFAVSNAHLHWAVFDAVVCGDECQLGDGALERGAEGPHLDATKRSGQCMKQLVNVRKCRRKRIALCPSSDVRSSPLSMKRVSAD